MKTHSPRFPYWIPAVVLTTGATWFISGCMVGPTYSKPVVKVPAAYTSPVLIGQEDIGRESWWSVFHDAQLDSLERTASVANKDIAVALARYDKAAAATRYERASLLPEVGSVFGAERNREPKYRPNNATSGHAITYNEFGAEVAASYDIDMWGRVRRAVRMSTAQRQAMSAEVRFVQLTVEAAIATTYCDVVEADQESRIIAERIAALEHARSLILERLHHGLATTIDLQRANSLVEEAIAERHAVGLRRAQDVVGLAILTGELPEGFQVHPRETPMTLPVVPTGLPIELLNRRPDLQQAERQVASASEQIGLAKAMYLPSIALTGAAGYQSTNVVTLLNWQSTVESLAASVVAPVFTGGRRTAAEQEARAEYRGALELYKNAVLHAYGDVEDQLAALQSLHEQVDHERSATEAGAGTLELTTKSYRSGLVSYVDVTSAEVILTVDQQNVAVLTGKEMTASVALIKSLGGGWKRPVLP